MIARSISPFQPESRMRLENRLVDFETLRMRVKPTGLVKSRTRSGAIIKAEKIIIVINKETM